MECLGNLAAQLPQRQLVSLLVWGLGSTVARRPGLGDAVFSGPCQERQQMPFFLVPGYSHARLPVSHCGSTAVEFNSCNTATHIGGPDPPKCEIETEVPFGTQEHAHGREPRALPSLSLLLVACSFRVLCFVLLFAAGCGCGCGCGGTTTPTSHRNRNTNYQQRSRTRTEQ